ncbi:copper resistance CopC family protein [Pseudarthrobacter cellobiosi]|uniref:copper resistance CopC family protein n=1 Tax=Pseudarthrobacter cellobiosi TaxID=2953654 RepID=UPI00208F1A18|nr:copper resistance CopC family protein [Pseudarthrobacter sp. HLT1-5]MCO4254481.1 copper resistance protein CopC [Pseudarthrobacter sp. HLT1-5]
MRYTTRRGQPHLLALLWSALVLGLVLTVIPAVPASAHAYLESSDPAQDAQLSAAPDSVSLVFDDDIQVQFTKVTLAVGSAAPATLATDIADQTVVVPVPASIAGRQPPGSTESWKVTYRTVAGDGHPVEGTLSFRVTASSPGASPATKVPTPAGTSASGATTQGPDAQPRAGDARQQAAADAAEPFPWPTVGLLSAGTLVLASVLWLLARHARRSGHR